MTRRRDPEPAGRGRAGGDRISGSVADSEGNSTAPALNRAEGRRRKADRQAATPSKVPTIPVQRRARAGRR